MANIKKATLKELVERLEKVENKVGELDGFIRVPVMGTVVSMPGMSTVTGISPSSTAGNPVSPVTITSVGTQVLPEVKHKCQTNTCESMDTKEYQGKDRKMWLCESHKF